MRAGDRIRIQKYISDYPTHTDDYTVEMFRYCLGVFMSDNARTAERFTPLCDLYEPDPESEQKYISNYGEYHTSHVQSWMDLPKPMGEQNNAAPV